MAGLEFDFQLYLGDPDEGAEAVESRELVKNLERLKGQIDPNGPNGPYGALIANVEGQSPFKSKPDPLVPLMTHVLKAVPYVIDGEPENVLWSESEHGLALAGQADEALVAFFAGGDAFEPDEWLLPQTPMPLKDFGEQMVGLGERLQTVMKAVAPELVGAESAFTEFLETASEAVKRYNLEVEHGLRGTNT